MGALLAKRIRDMRKTRDYSLEKLAELSGVSRSMISLIEREQTSPTAVVLNKLADALGISMAALFSDEDPAMGHLALVRQADQALWVDPGSGYVRRHVSPMVGGLVTELVEVSFPAGERVVFDNLLRQVEIQQQIWLLEGEMVISLGEQHSHLQAGDCLAMTLGQQIVFHNPTAKPARYALVLTSLPSATRRS